MVLGWGEADKYQLTCDLPENTFIHDILWNVERLFYWILKMFFLASHILSMKIFLQFSITAIKMNHFLFVFNKRMCAEVSQYDVGIGTVQQNTCFRNSRHHRYTNKTFLPEHKQHYCCLSCSQFIVIKCHREWGINFHEKKI